MRNANMNLIGKKCKQRVNKIICLPIVYTTTACVFVFPKERKRLIALRRFTQLCRNFSGKCGKSQND